MQIKTNYPMTTGSLIFSELLVFQRAAGWLWIEDYCSGCNCWTLLGYRTIRGSRRSTLG
jgi:hypothetical protein